MKYRFIIWLIFLICAAFLQASVGYFFEIFSVFPNLFLLLFLLFIYYDLSYYRAVIMAMVISIFEGIFSLAPITVFIISYIALGFAIIFLIKKFFFPYAKNIINALFSYRLMLMSAFAILFYELFFFIILKIFFIANISEVSVNFNFFFFKSLLIFTLYEFAIFVVVLWLFKRLMNFQK